MTLVLLLLAEGGEPLFAQQQDNDAPEPKRGLFQRPFEKKQGEDLPTTPILRINTEMHTATITRIAVNAAETTLATGSHDKTVKLWDLREGTVGELKRTLRLPSDVAGKIGMVYAVALSPDGSLVAAGGFTGSALRWKEKQGIYLYDAATGVMAGRIGGLPNVILHLAFSPDGRFLAATLGKGRGVRVYRVTSTGHRRPTAERERRLPIGATATEVFADSDYGGKGSYWVDWAPLYAPASTDGAGITAGPGERRTDNYRFATTCVDGRIRLYSFAGSDPGGAVRQSVATGSHGGNEPFSCAFSPHQPHQKGSRFLAVGYGDTTGVDVFGLSAPDEPGGGEKIRHAFAPDTGGIANGSLHTVAWSRDGTRLLAGGRYWDGTSRSVIEWEEAGRGGRRAWHGTPNTIMHLIGLSGGRTLIGAGDPAWKLKKRESRTSKPEEVEDQGEDVARWAETADFRDARDEFQLSNDGSVVRFGFEHWGKSPAVFSTIEARFLQEENAENLASPKTTSSKFQVSNVRDSTNPTFNGQPLLLKPHEFSYRLAIAPNDERFLLGTNFWLRCLDHAGEPQWEQPVPGEAWSVNISGDGRLAVAAFGDGTIRWFRLSDGEPLLAFFPHYDRSAGNPKSESRNPNGPDDTTPEDSDFGFRASDWVLWAPDTGHFRCSPDGARLIGWQVNRGKNANPDFYAAEQLYSVLEDRHGILQQVLREARPAREIIADLVARGEMKEPVPLAEALYGVPEVGLEVQGGLGDLAIAPTEWASVTAIARQTAENVGITRINLLVNGKPMRPSGKMTVRDGIARQRFQVRLLRGRNEISALAYNERRVSSFPVKQRLRYDGPVATSDLWVLGVGLETYFNPAYNLRHCLRDVTESAAAIQSRGAGIFDEEHFELLPDDQATRAAIEAKFAELAKKVKPEDTFIFVYAGHGAMNEESQFHLVPYDVTRIVNEDQLAQKAVPAEVLELLLAEVPAQKQVMLLDACHSGAITAQFRGAAEEVAIAQLSRATGVAILASSSADEFSRGDDDLEHGYFTYTVLEGLREGRADGNGDRKITVKELDAYVDDRLPQLTVERGKPPQFPQGYYRGADFPLGTVR